MFPALPQILTMPNLACLRLHDLQDLCRLSLQSFCHFYLLRCWEEPSVQSYPQPQLKYHSATPGRCKYQQSVLILVFQISKAITMSTIPKTPLSARPGSSGRARPPLFLELQGASTATVCRAGFHKTARNAVLDKVLINFEAFLQDRPDILYLGQML